jgi:hypothetical protein
MEEHTWTLGQIESGRVVPADEVFMLMADVLDRLANLIGEDRGAARDLVAEAWSITGGEPGSVLAVAEGLIACGRGEGKVPSFVILARFLDDRAEAPTPSPPSFGPASDRP